MFKLNSPEGGARLVASFFAVYLLWGSAFLAIRFSLESLPPLLMAGLRFFIAGVVLCFLARIQGSKGATGRQWLKAIIIGVLLFVIGNGGIVLAAVFLPSGLVSLMVAATPIYLVLFHWLAGGRAPGGLAIVGLLAGALGMVLLFGPSVIRGESSVPPLGMILAIIAPLAWALGSLYTRQADLPQSQLQVAGMEMLSGGAILLVSSIFGGETAGFHFEEVTVKSWLALAYLIVFCSIVGFSSYLYILKAASPALVATYAYVNPVVALFLGWAVAGEIVGTQTLLGSAVLLCAVWLLSRSAGVKQLPVEPMGALKPSFLNFSRRGFFMKIKADFRLHLACAIVSAHSWSLVLLQGLGRLLSILLLCLLKGVIGAAYLAAYSFGMVMLIPLLYDGVLLHLFPLPEHLGIVITFTVIAVTEGILLVAVMGYFYRKSPASWLAHTEVFMKTIFLYGILALGVILCYLAVDPNCDTSALARFVAWVVYGGAFLLPLTIWGLVRLVRWAYLVAPECAERARLP